MSQQADGRVAVVLKGWPRLSETFIAQEIAGLEARGVTLEIWSLRRPTDAHRHPVHDRVAARIVYLPEYLEDDPPRVWDAWRKARRLPGYVAARRAFMTDFRRDRTANRVRRWGQALVLAAELPASIDRLYAHFLHTPSSVTRYAALMRELPWSVSAHAKDIWTSEAWEISEKLAGCSWAVTCTAMGAARLRELAPSPDKVKLVYHGLDFAHLPPLPGVRSRRDGSDPADPVVILSIGRKVEKKGYGDLLDALGRLPRMLHWRFEHVGGGDLAEILQAQADRLGIAERIRVRLLSAEIGALKPEPAAFEAMERKLGLFPGNLAMVGDSWKDDVEGALEAGWTAIWVNREALPRPPHDADALVYEVRNLNYLPELIQGLQDGMRCPTCLG